jgi:hypothetical protein
VLLQTIHAIIDFCSWRVPSGPLPEAAVVRLSSIRFPPPLSRIDIDN